MSKMERDTLLCNRYELGGCMAGRKPLFKTAMTAADRMRRSRALRHEALGRITDDVTQAPTGLLAQALTRQVMHPHPDPETHKWLMQRYLNELCNRYETRMQGD
ncbi:hypothetical protein C4901_09045 [Acidiferrobacter sp. SPIII_3]|nr:hypothetical protein C4901_09045 [Acidiferrobacter sp. SPIII_3]